MGPHHQPIPPLPCFSVLRKAPNSQVGPASASSRHRPASQRAAGSFKEIAVIVFLDFDGVLHPDPCTERRRLFENAHRLVDSIAPFAEVGLVLSTAWRTTRPFAELLQTLPPALSDRVIDRTPLFGDFKPRTNLVPYRRHAECIQWLSQNHLQDGAWLALDDRPDDFAPYCDNLIVCHPQVGFDGQVEARLRSALLRHRQRHGTQVDLAIH